MLGVRSVSGLAFYDWDSTELVRRIEITPKQVRRTTTISEYREQFFIKLRAYVIDLSWLIH